MTFPEAVYEARILQRYPYLELLGKGLADPRMNWPKLAKLQAQVATDPMHKALFFLERTPHNIPLFTQLECVFDPFSKATSTQAITVQAVVSRSFPDLEAISAGLGGLVALLAFEQGLPQLLDALPPWTGRVPRDLGRRFFVSNRNFRDDLLARM